MKQENSEIGKKVLTDGLDHRTFGINEQLWQNCSLLPSSTVHTFKIMLFS